jgi:cardiolipin synthase
MKPDFLPGNRLQLLNSGHEYFPALIAAIDTASRDVHLETYIFEDDATGRAVADALIRAAGRGVAVRLLVDGFGGGDFPRTLMPRLLTGGVQVLIYRPEVARFRLRRTRLRRMHRKLAVIDACIAFVGGINIIDDLNTPHQIPPRFDYAVRIEGRLLDPINRATRRLWEVVSWANLRHRFRLPGTPHRARAAGDAVAAFVLRDNIRHRRAIETAYLDALRAAHSEVIIANAYFLPGLRFRHTLMAAARRGVKVTILLQGRIEYRLMHYATQALYVRFLGAGIRIFEYHRSFLHAKVAVVDGQWATVGSSNIDPFSLLLAKEANIVSRDAEFAKHLRQSLLDAMAGGARELRHEEWSKTSLLSRALRWTSYQLGRMAMGLLGYGRGL